VLGFINIGGGNRALFFFGGFCFGGLVCLVGWVVLGVFFFGLLNAVSGLFFRGV